MISKKKFNITNNFKQAKDSVDNWIFINNYEDFKNWGIKYASSQVKTINKLNKKKIKGFCYVCNKLSYFKKKYIFKINFNEREMINLREELFCKWCNFNSRLRCSIHIFKEVCAPLKYSKIYILEQVTPLYKYLKKLYPNLIGSEFIGKNFKSGEIINGIRHEDCTNLSFSNNSFDYILCFDVLEHIFDYKSALQEFYRCLRSNGILLISVPIIFKFHNLIRAIEIHGKPIFILKPDYHYSPNLNNKCLCYHYFGWELIENLKDVGFSYVKFITANPEFYYYFGYSPGADFIYAKK